MSNLESHQPSNVTRSAIPILLLLLLLLLLPTAAATGVFHIARPAHSINYVWKYHFMYITRTAAALHCCYPREPE